MQIGVANWHWGWYSVSRFFRFLNVSQTRFVFVCKAKVIPVYNGSSDLLPVILEETGGLGVDIVIDSGGKTSQLTMMNMCLIVKMDIRSVSVPSGFWVIPYSNQHTSLIFQLHDLQCNMTPGHFALCLCATVCTVRLQEEESEEMKLLPHKHDIISVLGVGGHWVTSHKDLQVSVSEHIIQLKFLINWKISILLNKWILKS